jgi:hypothetical protein
LSWNEATVAHCQLGTTVSTSLAHFGAFRVIHQPLTWLTSGISDLFKNNDFVLLLEGPWGEAGLAGNTSQDHSFYSSKYQPDWLHLREDFWLGCLTRIRICLSSQMSATLWLPTVMGHSHSIGSFCYCSCRAQNPCTRGSQRSGFSCVSPYIASLSLSVYV